MSKVPQSDIDDSQIRIIFSTPSAPQKKRWWQKKFWWIVAAIVILVPVVTYAIIAYKVMNAKDEIAMKVTEVNAIPVNTVSNDTVEESLPKAYTIISDTTLNGYKLTVITPIGGRPELTVGGKALNDTTARLVVQAADIRGDNGKIVGAFVSKGQLLSTGESKAGFCAIIGGNITIGVADSSPYLEQALESGGDFFRQYPLVVGGQIVENKPKGVSFRKALAELNGRIVVILSREKMSFHDFSQSLVDLGVSNAIYLVGSTAYGFARQEDGATISFGAKTETVPENISYLVWHK